MNIRILLSVIATSASLCVSAVVPQPHSYEKRSGEFSISETTTICVDDAALLPAAEYLAEYTGLGVSEHSPESDFIRLATVLQLETEGYSLTVADSGITILGGGYGGVFNGIQTLLQLLPDGVYSHACPLPAYIGLCRIDDAPQFGYRGLMLDIVRTWMDIDKVKRYIDLAAYHKINKLHIHLSDDEGWRIEIKSHPELAEVGGWRGRGTPVWPVYGKWDERYGGFYTQEEMRSIIDYAAVRNIEIIPEIDLPGHSRTIARIHPEILCGYTPDMEITGGYDYRRVWCVAREENYELLEDILGEICGIFPSKYIHIGGDEVETTQWEQCPHCKAYADEHCGGDTARLQEVFMARISDILVRHGKLPAVWNEASARGSLLPESRVYGWESIDKCRAAASKGYKTVVMAGKYFYLDMRQSQHEDGHTWAGVFDVGQCCSFDFAAEGFTEAQLANVAGVEAVFWSELYASHNPEKTDYTDYQLFPRLCAVAEIGWGKRSDAPTFLKRLCTDHYSRMADMGIRFRLSPPRLKYTDGKLTASTDDGSTIYCKRENDTLWSPFTQPIATTKPAEYLFRSEYRSGVSPAVGVAGHYTRLKPALKMSSTIPASKEKPYANAERYRGVAQTARTCREGDSITFEFEQPVRCREAEFLTGYEHLPRFIFEAGYVETSLDGVQFERAAELHGGRARLVSPRPFRFARIVCTRSGSGTPYIIVSPPIIKPLL